MEVKIKEKAKYKMGDIVYFMRYDTPAKGVIIGIGVLQGLFSLDGLPKDAGTGIVIYSIEGAYGATIEYKLFATKEALQNELFKDL